MKDGLIKMPSDSGGFLGVRCPGGKILYGGAQHCFSDERYRLLGCGTISMANIISYMSAVGKYENFPVGNFSPALMGYMRFADELNKKIPPDVNGLRWMKIYKELTGDSVRYFPLFCTPKEYFFGTVINSLEKDIPLMISVYNRKGYEIFPCDENGDILKGEKSEFPKAHYMTLTAVYCAHGERRLIVSSWGRRFSFDLDDYYRQNRHILINGIGNGIGSGIFEIVHTVNE